MALPRYGKIGEVDHSPEGPSERDPRQDGNAAIEHADMESVNIADEGRRSDSQDHAQGHHRTLGDDSASSTYDDETHNLRSGSQDEEKSTATEDSLWNRNKGVILMILAQFFNTVMAAIARLMETAVSDLPPMSPFQMIFARQSVTVVLSLLYMWWYKIPDAPFGSRDVRPWLVARGLAGFTGLFGLYTSLETLPVSDAVLLTFLAPMLASYLSACIIKTPFTRQQQIAGFVCIVGVVLVTRPVSLLTALTSKDYPPEPDATAPWNTTSVSSDADATAVPTLADPSSTGATPDSHDVSTTTHPVSRAIAVCFSLLGVLGTSCTFFTISHIGQRAHPLISVNYFSSFCTILSALALAFIPAVPFRLPASAREWLLLALLGASGFTMQFLLTASLAHRKSTLVLNLVYVQMLFALGFDWVLWGLTPGLMSWLGGALILASVVWVSVRKEGEKEAPKEAQDEERANRSEQDEDGRWDDEGRGLMAGIENREDDESREDDGSSDEGNRDKALGKV